MDRVLIVDRNRLFADAVRTFLARERIDVQVAATAEEAMAAARLRDPQLVVIDAGLPDEDPIVAGRRILDECPTARLVAMAASADPILLRRAARAGFVGVLTKAPPVSRFIRAIRRVAKSRRFEAPATTSARGGSVAASPDDPSFLAQYLTARERQVLALLAAGESTRGIASRLAISRNTARSHVQNVLTKLQVRSRLEAATFAVRHGIVRPDDGDDVEPAEGSSSAGTPPPGRLALRRP